MLNDYLIEELIQNVEELSSVNMEELPSLKAMALTRDKLVADYGWKYDEACSAVVDAQFVLPSDVSQQVIERLSEAVAALMEKALQAHKKYGLTPDFKSWSFKR